MVTLDHFGTSCVDGDLVEEQRKGGRLRQPPFLLPASCAAGKFERLVLRARITDQGIVIVPEAVMIASAAVLMRPLPLPVAFVNLPVPPTIVWVICRNSGVFVPAA